MNLTTYSNHWVSLDEENLLCRITNRIRHSPELQTILDVTVVEVKSFLNSDRVMIYKFHPDQSGQVIAESIQDNRLPSLLGLNFPADDIPAYARELFVRLQVRSIVDVARAQIGQDFSGQLGAESDQADSIFYRPIDPCHLEYLTAMGVQSSLVIPILYQEALWGLLVAHHSEPQEIIPDQLQSLQMVVDQISIAIAHTILLNQAREKAQREATLSQIATLLHSLLTIEFDAALKQTVQTLNASGGRIYLLPEILACWPAGNANSAREGAVPEAVPAIEGDLPPIHLYTEGVQPVMPELSKFQQMEQYVVWQQHFEAENHRSWAISDLYEIPELRNLQAAFRPTAIRGILIVPLRYRQRALGYLSLFRDEVDVETLWAGYHDSDQRQLQPRLSFEIWKESKRGQVKEWNQNDIELAQAIGEQFATAIHQYEMHQQVQSLSNRLESQVQERTKKLQLATEQQKILFRVVTKIRESLDLERIFKTTVKEVRRSLNVDRVLVFHFDPESNFNSGTVIAEDVLPNFLQTLGREVEDHCFAEKFVAQYRLGRVQAVANIHAADLQDCHLALLERLQAIASLVVPLRNGDDLWGLLCIHHCAQSHEWTTSEIQFVTQIATQLGIALQQVELLEQTQQQSVRLKQSAGQQQILFEVVTKMRKSLKLSTIFTTVTQEVRRSLNADRAIVYRFDPDSEFNDGEVIAEDVLPGFTAAIATKIHDHCFGERYATQYSQGRVFAMADIHAANMEDCYVKLLEQFQIQATLVAPVIKGNRLWGLFCVHQCSQPREWQLSEIQFCTQIAAQLSVALEQADLLSQTKQQAKQLTEALKNLQQTQTQLIQTEKMSGLGQMVAGVAHEINNPVNFIYGNLVHVNNYVEDLLGLLELYQQRVPDPGTEICDRIQDIDLDFLTEDLQNVLESMKVGTERIQQIVLSLRNFSRLDQSDMKSVDIHEGIESTLLILQHRLKAKTDKQGIEIIKEYGQLPQVECYAGQLNQVFMNVLSNAIDALHTLPREPLHREPLHPETGHPASPAQNIALPESSPEKLPSPQIRIHTQAVDATQIAIAISDNGVGIDADLCSRIFDPFFTTKPVGQGTGLGLSISYQIIVDKHHGSFTCESQPGQGTTFWIQIPVCQSNSCQIRTC